MNERVRVLADTLSEGEGALILSEPNRRYYTGFSSSDGALWVTAEEAGFLTDFRYSEAAAREVDGIPVTESARLFRDAAEQLYSRGIRRVLLESERITLADRDRLRKAQGDIEWAGGDTLDDAIRSQRRRKEPQELAAIRASQALTDASLTYILERLAPGVSEREIALDIEMFMRKEGASAVAFDLIVAAGENGSLPHAVPGDRRIRKGDFVTMDIGAVVDGYCSDMTRTVAVGEADDEQKAVYATVLSAQKACLAGLKPGLSGKEGDALARDVIDAAGYGANFGHSTGHGVGLEIHEFPRLSPGEQTELMPGDVVTVEPGIYLPGRLGVRIEDMVAVTRDGVEDFTRSPKELLIV